MGSWDQFHDGEEDEAFRDAMEMAEAVKDGWGARTQLAACLAVAEAALLSKAAKAQRREQAEDERRREAQERAMAAQREREERELREIVAAREREALRVRREREARQSPIPAAPSGPRAEELRRRERERHVAAEERAAKVRLTNAQAAEIEAKAELMRAQARAAGASSIRSRASPRETASDQPVRAAPRPTGLLARIRPPRYPSPELRAGSPPALASRAPAPAPAPVLPPVVPGGTAAESSVGRLTAASGVLSVPALTGADLACFRAERKLSQRELAALMGVGHGMVAKAELVRERGLGEGMASAFARVALPATATR